MNQSIKSVLLANNAVSLLLLGQINFQAGIQMMKALREENKLRKALTEDAIRNDTAVADEFAEYAPEQAPTMPLDTCVNLVAASLILAHDIKGEGLDFLKKNIRSPQQVIVSQMEWIANQEAQQRLALAHKFGLAPTVDKFYAVIRQTQAEAELSYITEARSVILDGIKGMDARHLHHLIEESYFVKDWQTKLADSAVSLFESAAKRLDGGKFADLPDEVIELARSVISKKQTAEARLKAA